MKIAVVGDLHLDISPVKFKNNNKIADVLLLTGDVAESKWILENAEFFKKIRSRFDEVYAIKGNHECYFDDLLTVDKTLRDFYKSVGITYLQREIVDLDSTRRLLGATMWTSFYNDDPIVKWNAQRSMNDYNYIMNGEYRIVADVILSEHQEDMLFLDTESSVPGKDIIIMTHHAPLLELGYHKDARYDLSGAYCVDLYEFIKERPMIKMWFSGHVHRNEIFDLGDDQTVVSHSRGYYNELVPSSNFEDVVKIFEI